MFLFDCIYMCVCPQHVKDYKGSEKALTYQSSDTILDGIADTEA